MQKFNRILGFDPARRTIEVEAGMTLGELLAVTARAGLWLPVLPGYPGITVGGCIAANVHGKNPFRDGTFRSCVADLTLFHPDHGFRRLSETEGATAFELTCGGYGLTGIVVERDPAPRAPRGRPGDGEAPRGRQSSGGGPRGAGSRRQEPLRLHVARRPPRRRTFGRGYVYEGILEPGGLDARQLAVPYRVLTATARARLPFSLWNRPAPASSRRGTGTWSDTAPEVGTADVFDAMFPFARRSAYFRLFGRPGLVEYQVIVAPDRAESFLAELGRLLRSAVRPRSCCR